MANTSMAVVRDTARAAHLLDPMRVSLLERLSAPGSASTLARELGVPRQRVNYHLRELEKAGFVELVEERRKGNCVERLVKATAHSYLISPEVLGVLGDTPEEQQDKFSASYLLAAAGRMLRDLSGHVDAATAARKRVATLTLETDIRFATAEDRTAFAEELSTAVARIATKYHDAKAYSGRTFHLVVGAYPAVARPAANSRSGAAGSAVARPAANSRDRAAVPRKHKPKE
jgi:DNA-binding transcriptional ArsR family regulator